MMNFGRDCKTVLMNTSLSAGQGTTNTSIFDMGDAASVGGFDAIAVLVVLNTVVSTATVQVNLQDNTANQSSGMATVTATGPVYLNSQNTANATVAQDSSNAGFTMTDVGGNSSNSVLVLDVALPLQRYVRAVIVRAVANVTVGGVIGILYRGKQRPTVQDATNVIMGSFIASS